LRRREEAVEEVDETVEEDREEGDVVLEVERTEEMTTTRKGKRRAVMEAEAAAAHPKSPGRPRKEEQ
jgi:hypothetical protein